MGELNPIRIPVQVSRYYWLRKILLSLAALLCALVLNSNFTGDYRNSASAQVQRLRPFPICHLVSREEGKVSAAMTLKIHAPHLEAREWIVYEPSPPNLRMLQSLNKEEAFISNESVPFRKVAEQSNSHREILLIRVPVQNKSLQQDLTARIHYFMTLYSKKLVDGPPEEPVELLTASEQTKYLNASKTIDYRAADFQKWLLSQDLSRQSNEKDIDFAWRSFLQLRKLYEYNYAPKQDRRISTLCTTGSTDCGGLSFLFCGIMRANGIPARPLVGRWLKPDPDPDSTKPIKGQFHVKAEFYAAGIGWVPVDMSLAVSNKSEAGSKYFGVFDGRFITFHEDTDLLVDSIWFGQNEIGWMQSPLYWVTGGGNLNDDTETLIWQTRQ